MQLNYIAEQIKTLIPLPQAIEIYTGERLNKNKMHCPLHSEKTASFTVYSDNNSFYCFGCGAGGNIIDFVMQYFNIGFKEAIRRIDSDYNLGLTREVTFSEYRKHQQEIAKIKAVQERQREQKQQINIKYWAAFDRVFEYERIIKALHPESPDDEPHPEFIKALQNIEYARHLLTCAENERR